MTGALSLFRSPCPDLAQFFQHRTPFSVQAVLETPYFSLSAILHITFQFVLLFCMSFHHLKPELELTDAGFNPVQPHCCILG